MKIGVAIDLDPNKYINRGFFGQADCKILKDYCRANAAPSANTLILSFVKGGHFVRVFTLAKENFIVRSANLEIIGVKQYSKYPIKYLWGIFYDGQSLRENIGKHIADLDVLHAHWTYSYAYGASFFSDVIPVFCSVRDWTPYIWKMESLKNKIFWGFKWIMANKVYRHKNIHFIANSPYTAECIKSKYRIEVPVIPNSIHADFIKQDDNLKPLSHTILCISSSNDKRKNIKTLLEAFSLFGSKHPEMVLQLIGSPFTMQNREVREWEEKGLLERCELIGEVNHLALMDYIDKAMMLVTPSLEETFGNTLIEAMARKTPVVGGVKSGAVPYVLHHGKAGFLCDVSSPEDICIAMEYIYLNPDSVLKVVDTAFKIVLGEYSESVVCDRHINIYKDVVR